MPHCIATYITIHASDETVAHISPSVL